MVVIADKKDAVARAAAVQENDEIGDEWLTTLVVSVTCATDILCAEEWWDATGRLW